MVVTKKYHSEFGKAKLRRARIASTMQAILDAVLWVCAILTASHLRYEFDTSLTEWKMTIVIAVLSAATYVLVGLSLGLYLGKYSYGSFDEVRIVTIAVLANTLLLTTVIMMLRQQLDAPRSLAIIALPLALVFMFGVRYLRRLIFERSSKPGQVAAPALIVGAGQAGEIAVRAIMNDPRSPLRVVGFIDDDQSKKRLRLHGVSVLGRARDIPKVALSTGAEVLIIAIGDAEPELLRALTDAGTDAGMRVLITPTVKRMVEGPISVTDIRSVPIEDLIGRHPVDTQVESIAGYVTGKRVLVTGAGGSIGSELCLQLSKFGPKELIMLDRDETGLQQAQISVCGNGLLDSNDVLLVDIREAELVEHVFELKKPEVVFHAAALKHLPMLEQFPEEAWKTNVLGTLNVVQAAKDVGVETFVNISTDKAANPTSALGHSKRVAEKITAWAGEVTGKPYLSVRFGNVIGSRGSMLPTFQSLIEKGGPLTVTHPEATRYFMTIPEACQLVIQAGGIGRPGEVLILDMGQPVNILDIAKRMIAMSGKEIEIVFTGLREGEKLHEELVGVKEDLERPFHNKISHTAVDTIAPENLELDVWLKRMYGEKEQNI